MGEKKERGKDALRITEAVQVYLNLKEFGKSRKNPREVKEMLAELLYGDRDIGMDKKLSYIYQLNQGTKRALPSQIRAIAEALHSSADFLLGTWDKAQEEPLK